MHRDGDRDLLRGGDQVQHLARGTVDDGDEPGAGGGLVQVRVGDEDQVLADNHAEGPGKGPVGQVDGGGVERRRLAEVGPRGHVGRDLGGRWHDVLGPRPDILRRGRGVLLRRHAVAGSGRRIAKHGRILGHGVGGARVRPGDGRVRNTDLADPRVGAGDLADYIGAAPAPGRALTTHAEPQPHHHDENQPENLARSETAHAITSLITAPPAPRLSKPNPLVLQGSGEGRRPAREPRRGGQR